MHRDPLHGGYYRIHDGRAARDDNKQCYGHAFVLLAASFAEGLDEDDQPITADLARGRIVVRPAPAGTVANALFSLPVVSYETYGALNASGNAAYLQGRNFRLLATAGRQVEESISSQALVIRSIIQGREGKPSSCAAKRAEGGPAQNAASSASGRSHGLSISTARPSAAERPPGP